MQYITALELKKKCDNKEDVFVVDIRESYELDICKFKAVHIPMEDVPMRISELDPHAESVVVCKTGKRAEAVANLLIQEYGFSNLKVLEGGMLSWIENVETHLEVY